ncbi:MAG: VCBS repeat-containing protein, partial [Deltaproteobacteria bacterium]|nr:VCBS repeat-containing protein [Deltaproteobacteria bacterium]
MPPANRPRQYDAAKPAMTDGLPCSRRARWTKHSLRLLLVLLLGACELGCSELDGGSAGGSSGAATGGTTGGGTSEVAAATSIDLEPGQTEATLAWAPSAGNVDNYVVYESRNDAEYGYLASVSSPSVSISGSEGDAVRVIVLAVNMSGQPSTPSAPSPELVFHATAAAATSNAGSAPAAARMAQAAGTTPVDSSPDATTVASAGGGSGSGRLADVSNSGDSGDATNDEPTTTLIDASMRELLVSADARFPTEGLSEPAQSWIQARVEEQFSAGVQLVGSGELDGDGVSDLVWQDAAGQLLVSSGSAVAGLASSSDIPSTFEDGIRLRPTERFIALSDFNGDSIGDWVVEDTSTGDVWIIDGESLEATTARGSDEPADLLLVGHGDFDADGREEFVWQRADGRLQLGHPSGTLPSIGTALPNSLWSRLLAVADVDGDGHDDLLSVDPDGRLELNLIVAVGSDF